MKNAKTWFLAVVAALGGFLFGFDTIVICGAEQDIQRLWGLSGTMHGFVVSSALWGTVIGSMLGGAVSDRFGRRRTLQAVGLLFLASAAWSALASGPWTMVAARFIGGLGVGVSTIAAPSYIAEISPPESRGRMTALFQFNIVLGVLVSLASNLALKDVGESAWRWMLGVEAFPALLFTVLSVFLVESPRWLAMRAGQGGGAAADVTPAGGRFWSRANMRPILIAFFVAFFNQLSGVNAINYFMVRIFELAGFGRDTAFLQTFVFGIVNFVSTFTGVWLIDRIGRRSLLVLGGVGYIVSLSLATCGFASGLNVLSAISIFLFIAAHAIGQGTVIWVLVSEVFPQRFRAEGQTLGSFTHWFFAALITFCFPIFAGDPSDPASAPVPTWTIFAFFLGMMVLHLLWAIFFVPETKGKRLEDIRL